MPLILQEEPIPLRKDRDGVIRVANTRVTLLSILSSFQQGYSPEAIVEQFPTVQLADIYATIAFYLRRKPEVDEYLEEERRSMRSVQEEYESRFPAIGIRDRLLARKQQIEK